MFFVWIRRYFLAGILAILPIGITGWVLWKVFEAVDGTVLPWLLRVPQFEQLAGQIPLRGLGFLATVLFVILVGMFASNFIGRTLLGGVNSLVERLPIVSRIYVAVKQIGEGILGANKRLFERCVLFEYPRRGLWAMGFVTSEHHGALEERNQKKMLHVFVPTTPNPTSGFLLFVPADEIIDLDISVEDGLKLVISGGVVAPAASEMGSSPSTEEGSVTVN